MKLNSPSRYMTTFISFVAKLLFAFMQIIISPLLVNKLGLSNFAVYNFLIGISVWFTILDLSIGVTLQNEISEKYNKKMPTNHLINYAFSFVVYSSIFYTIVFSSITPLVKLCFLNKITHGGSIQISLAWSVFCMFFVCNILSQMVIKIYYAKNLAIKANIASLISTCTTFLLVFMVVKTVNSPYILSIIFFTLTVSSILINFILFLKITDKISLMPLKKFSNIFLEKFNQSKSYFLFSIGGMLVLQLDYFFIAYFLRSNDIVEYNFISRVFAAVSSFYCLVLVNFYPDCAKYIYNKQWNAIKSQTKIHISLGIFMIFIVTIFFLYYKNFLTHYFLHDIVFLNSKLILIMAAYYVIRVISDTFCIILTMMNKGGFLLRLVLIQLVIAVPLQLYLIKLYGLIGMMTGLIVSFISTSLFFVPKKVYNLAMLSEKKD